MKFKPPAVRNQTAKLRNSATKSILAKRASTAHPTLRDSNKNNLNSISQIDLNIAKEESKLTEESNDTFFVHVKRVKSSSVSNVLRKRPIAISNKVNKIETLRQSSLPIFSPSTKNEVPKMDVIMKFHEIFLNLI